MRRSINFYFSAASRLRLASVFVLFFVGGLTIGCSDDGGASTTEEANSEGAGSAKPVSLSGQEVGSTSQETDGPAATAQERAEEDEGVSKTADSGDAEGDPSATGDDKVHGTERAEPNRLAKETSPYLLLHAHNPVDWYPWGPEALEKAKKEGKLIFLSIGYSSCHWCHVMERESFSDPEIAAILNQNFVCIKVDREERPDIDNIYMTSLYVFNRLSGAGGGGGWPLSMFLTPEAKPFFGGTYFPARDGDRGAGTGFLTLVNRIQNVWKEQPAALRRDADSVTEVTQLQLAGDRANPLFRLNEEPFETGIESLAEQFDPEHGGFGYSENNPRRPKFPEPSNLFLLLEQIKADPDDQTSRKVLKKTLDELYQGGIYDQLAGGFHRYSVDRFWNVPHFEKMLYDNAQLISIYAEAYKIFGDPAYKRIVEETIAFSVREMRDSSGAFWSAMDADSEGEEGAYYRWTAEELREVIAGDDDWAVAAAAWGVGGEPNFEEEYYVLRLSESMAATAEQQGVTLEEWQSKLDPLKTALLDRRAKRERPLTDTKILTSWNGMMIRGLADAGRRLDNVEYIDLAAEAADAILKTLVDEEGRLYRTQGKDRPILKAYVDDYALLIDGFIALHEATDEQRWIDEAIKLLEIQQELFEDEKNGGYFYTADDHESLLARAKNPVDNVVPSGNSLSALNLIYLGNFLDRPDWLDQAETTIRSVNSLLQQSPTSVTRLLIANRRYLELRPDRANQTLVDESEEGETPGDVEEDPSNAESTDGGQSTGGDPATDGEGKAKEAGDDDAAGGAAEERTKEADGSGENKE